MTPRTCPQCIWTASSRPKVPPFKLRLLYCQAQVDFVLFATDSRAGSSIHNMMVITGVDVLYEGNHKRGCAI